MAMFSSMPMKYLPKDETYFEFFPAKHVTQYLSDYVDQKIYHGRSLRQRIQFHTRVIEVEFSAATRMWKISCHGRPQPLLATNLLVAAGLTSQPNMPQILGQETFQGTLMHHVDFGKSSIMKDQEMKHIAVLGGAKSAADVAYAVAKAGKTVSWIIRKSGSGPAHFAPAKGVGPYKNSGELLYTRLTASLTPSIWNGQNWLSSFWHGTRLGRRIVGFIWGSFDSNARREAGFDVQRGIDSSDNGFHNLEPDTSYVYRWTIPSRPC
jgi:dimethylaniline monooxygenase (N-oxide forming)